VSVKTAHLLGFHNHGTAKVKVEYVGMAPLAGSDDRKLMATLREGTPAEPPVQVASADRSFTPTYFDRRRTSQIAPIPAERPYRLGETDVEGAPEVASSEATQNSGQAPEAPSAGFAPVSSFAPAPYGGPAGFMSGRGLY
jgi:rare lipoprotein A